MDSQYWDEFYKHQEQALQLASSFARACAARLTPSTRLFELGCGNGRDALYFAGLGVAVIACDQSAVAIATLERQAAEHGARHAWKTRPGFIAGDFTRLPADWNGELDVVYSRFTLHAITREEASRVLAWSAAALRPVGELLIEVRSVKGSLYGKGEPVEGEPDAFIHDGHYRRFVRSEELTAELEQLGFRITDLDERDGVSVYKADDPVVIRVVATRR